MKSFKDKSGTTYDIALTIGACKKIKSRLSVDILNLSDETVEKLYSDDLLIAEIVAVLLEDKLDQIGAQGVIDNFDGATVDTACKAFLEELTSFFAERNRPDKSAILKKLNQITEKAVQNVAEEVDKIEI